MKTHTVLFIEKNTRAREKEECGFDGNILIIFNIYFPCNTKDMNEEILDIYFLKNKLKLMFST